MRQLLKDDDFFIMVVFIAMIVAIVMVLIFAPRTPGDCTSALDSRQSCLDYRFDQCVATERYTRDECIRLVGAK